MLPKADPCLTSHVPETCSRAGRPGRNDGVDQQDDKGLIVACRLDASAYGKGIKVFNAEMATSNIQPASFHGEWTYTVVPTHPRSSGHVIVPIATNTVRGGGGMTARSKPLHISRPALGWGADPFRRQPDARPVRRRGPLLLHPHVAIWERVVRRLRQLNVVLCRPHDHLLVQR